MERPIRCVAVDDEPLALEIIAEYVEKVPALDLLACISDPVSALEMIRTEEVDLVFLDIQMPELTGIEFIQAMDRKCDIILTTAYPQFALEGFELDVTDYLLKPISFERFHKAIRKILDRRQMNNDYIFVKSDQGLQKLNLNDILYIEGLKDYVSIYTIKERIISLQVMKNMESVLPSNRFRRIHRSYIVALDQIDRIERNKVLIGDNDLPIGETYKDTFLKLIGERNSL